MLGKSETEDAEFIVIHEQYEVTFNAAATTQVGLNTKKPG